MLDLSYNSIRGELPPFGLLPGLRVLRLGRNLLFGSVPEELLENSVSLEELDLSVNGFTGKWFRFPLTEFLTRLRISLSVELRVIGTILIVTFQSYYRRYFVRLPIRQFHVSFLTVLLDKCRRE